MNIILNILILTLIAFVLNVIVLYSIGIKLVKRLKECYPYEYMDLFKYWSKHKKNKQNQSVILLYLCPLYNVLILLTVFYERDNIVETLYTDVMKYCDDFKKVNY